RKLRVAQNTDLQGFLAIRNVTPNGNNYVVTGIVRLPQPVMVQPFNADTGESLTAPTNFVPSDGAGHWSVTVNIPAPSANMFFIAESQLDGVTYSYMYPHGYHPAPKDDRKRGAKAAGQ